MTDLIAQGLADNWKLIVGLGIWLLLTWLFWWYCGPKRTSDD